MAQIPGLRVGFAGTSNLDSRGHIVSPGLAKCMEDLGFEISEENNLDVLININHNWKSISEQMKSSTSSPVLKILIRVEPSSVYPSQYTSEVESKYDLILTPGNVNVANQSEFIRWPYNYNLNPSAPSSSSPDPLKIVDKNQKMGFYSFANWEKRDIDCSLIAANKISPNGTGNYGLRRQFASQDLSDGLDVYGQLWDSKSSSRLKYRLAVLKFAFQSKSEFHIRHIFADFNKEFKNVRGPVIDKHTIIAQSKFSLVIENTEDYVSEKLLDALIGGSIPIYFGPSLEITGIPDSLVIRCDRNESNLIKLVQKIDRAQIEEKLEDIVDFLNGNEFPLWSSDVVNMEICLRIAKFVRSYP